VPYRCFYSRNIDNLFMAGRCISVTHEALGTTRVMKTCGMMGEVVGKAASLCVLHQCQPRDVYQQYWSEMDQLLQLPGKAFRATVRDQITVPADALRLAGPYGLPSGLDAEQLAGIVIDNRDAQTDGKWTSGTGLKGYVNYEYIYAGADSGATARFPWQAGESGKMEIRLAYQPHENRGSSVPVTVDVGGRRTQLHINMKQAPPIDKTFISLGTFDIHKGDLVTVTVSTEQARGTVHADAVQIVPVK
jgi:hypothetical protein